MKDKYLVYCHSNCIDPISLTERKPPINHLFVLNEKCVHWKAEKYEEDTEVYKVKADATFIIPL